MKNYFKKKYLEDNPILDDKIYGFFSRNGGSSKGSFESLNCALNVGDNIKNVESNRDLICQYCNVKKKNIVFINQIHSSRIVAINKKNINLVHNADGMITKSKGIVLCILTADCAPVIIIGEEYIGIIHVGWRGLMNGIIENTIDTLNKHGERIKNLIVAVGPHLTLNSFEVQRDFKKKLIKSNKLKYLVERDGSFFFNFSKCILGVLNNMQVKRYYISNHDTYSNPSLFFSHRYSKKANEKNCGRQVSIVGIKNT